MPNMLLNLSDVVPTNLFEIQERPIDPKHLYAHLLFFDRLAALNPMTPPAFVSSGKPMAFLDTPRGHLQELVDLGIYKAYSWINYEEFSSVVPKFLEWLSKNWSEGDWLVHPSFVCPSSPRSIQYAALRVELSGGLVIPDPSIHIEDILRFKERRSPELLGFWDEIYEVTQSVDFDDKTGRLQVERRRLEQKIEDVNTVSEESWLSWSRVRPTIGLQFNLATVLAMLAAAGEGGALPIIGAAAGLIGLGLDYRTQNQAPTQAVRAVSYVVEAMDKFP